MCLSPLESIHPSNHPSYTHQSNFVLVWDMVSTSSLDWPVTYYIAWVGSRLWSLYLCFLNAGTIGVWHQRLAHSMASEVSAQCYPRPAFWDPHINPQPYSVDSELHHSFGLGCGQSSRNICPCCIYLKWKFLVSLETQSFHMMSFWKLSSGRMFCWSRHVRGCFAENRRGVFLQVALVKRHVMFCWSRCSRGYWFTLQLFAGLC